MFIIGANTIHSVNSDAKVQMAEMRGDRPGKRLRIEHLIIEIINQLMIMIINRSSLAIDNRYPYKKRCFATEVFISS